MSTAMMTTTVPWIVWARFGQSTLRSSADRLADEAAAAARLVLDRRDRRTAAGCGRLRRAARLARRLLAGCAARVAPLPAGLVGHG